MLTQDSNKEVQQTSQASGPVLGNTTVANASPAGQNNTPKNPNSNESMQSAWNEIDKQVSTVGNEAVHHGNVDIYSMPREFQKHNTVAGSSFSVGTFVMVASIILLLIAGSAFLLSAINPELFSKVTGIQLSANNVVVKPTEVMPEITEPPIITDRPEINATSTEDLPVVASTTVKLIYQDYSKELAKINNFSDYYILINKYGSRYKVQQAETEKLLANSSVDKGQATVLNLKQKTPVLNEGATIVEELIDDNHAQLNITLSDGVSKGVVDFVQEDGSWKLDNESWQLAKSGNDNEVYVIGEDRDQDELSDMEETLLGSSSDSSDTDGDGYSDASEVANLYDPAKKTTKLVESKKIDTYIGATFTIIRPSEWLPNSQSRSDSIIFTSPDDHFIQVIVEDNSSNETLDAFYMRNLQLMKINPDNRISADDWSGIKTDDGMVVYIIPKINQNKIYLIQYDPGESRVLEYQKIFNAMVKSSVVLK